MKNISRFLVGGFFCFSLLWLVQICHPLGTSVSSGHDGSRYDQNATSFDIDEPKMSSFSIPTHMFEFTTSESCEAHFDWTQLSGDQISFESPAVYESTTASIGVQVMDYFLNATTIRDASANYSPAEQVQAFVVSSDSYLAGISVNIEIQNKEETVLVQIRNETYNGNILYSQPATFTADGWHDITFVPTIFLPAGNYFVYMASTWEKKAGWQRSADGDSITETLINNGGSWEDPDWDLALKVQLREVINPSSVSLHIGGQSVEDTPDGGGAVTVTAPVTGSEIILSISNTTPIMLNYAIEAVFARETTPSLDINLDGPTPEWTLETVLQDPEGIFTNYQANITGFRTGHTNIGAYKDEEGVGLTRPIPEKICLQGPADCVTFRSPNYLSSLAAPSELLVGDTGDFELEALTSGDLSFLIVQGTETHFSETRCNVQSSSFEWEVSSTVTSGSVEYTAYFLGDNQVGYLSGELTVKNLASLSGEELGLHALEKGQFSISYIDGFSGNPIDGATVTFSVEEYSGELVFMGEKYTTNMDFSQFALPPGTYEIRVQAAKEGYSTVWTTIPLVIEPREAEIQVARSSSVVRPEQVLQLGISLRDNQTGTTLDRPVNVLLRLIPRDGSEDAESVYTHTFEGISHEAQLRWNIPSGIWYGKYDIAVEVLSEYYVGEAVVTGAVSIFPPFPWWQVLTAGGAVASVASGGAIYHKRDKVKHSLRGFMIIQDSGVPIKEKISPEFSKADPMTISGAVSGIVTLIRQITGTGVRTIEVEGGYLCLAKAESFWLVLFLRERPTMINGIIKKLLEDLEKMYGQKFALYHGENLFLPLDDIVRKRFGVNFEGRDTTQLEKDLSMEEMKRQRSKVRHECPICKKVIRPGVEKKVISEIKKFPYRHVVIHGNPLHAAVVYFDANFTIRSLEGANSVEVAKDEATLEEVLKKWVNPT